MSHLLAGLGRSLVWLGQAVAASVPAAQDPPRSWPVPPLVGGGVFVENAGQWPSWIRFVARRDGALLRLEQGAIALELRDPSGNLGRLVRVAFEDAAGEWTASGEQPERHAFLLGDDPEAWTTHVRAFDEVRVRDLYPGIDLVLTGGERGLAHELHVAPGADPGVVRVRVEGLEDAEPTVDRCDPAATGGLGPPWSTTQTFETLPDGRRRSVISRWMELGDGVPAAALAGRDIPRASESGLGLSWSTYLGGSGDDGLTAVAGDPTHEVVVTGGTQSVDFPRTPGTFQAKKGVQNIFLVKLASDGALVYSSVFGGTLVNGQRSIDVSLNKLGVATVVGVTCAPDFPTTAGSFDPKKDVPDAIEVGFVTQFSSSGQELVFSTYFEPRPPATNSTTCQSVCDLGNGDIVVGGGGGQPGTPVTPGAFQATFAGGVGDGFVCKLTERGSTLAWSSLIGGEKGDAVMAITVGADDHVHLTGQTSSLQFPTTPGTIKPTVSVSNHSTGFVAKVSPDGSTLVWSTYLGGSKSGNQDPDVPWSIAVDALGTVFVAGSTQAVGFPTTPGAYKEVYPPSASQQGFLSRLDPLGSSLIYSTFVGGNNSGGTPWITVDLSGVVTAGGGLQEQWPLTPGALDLTYNGGVSDVVVVRWSPQGDRMFYGTYIGGPGHDSSKGFCASAGGRATTGQTIWFPGGFPTTPGAFQQSYNGGQNDASIATLDLFLQGLAPGGGGVPSCLGDLQLNATEMPAAGSASFAIWCSGAPPLARGWLLLGEALAAPIQVGRLPLLVSPAGPLAGFPVSTDVYGYVEVDVPLSSATGGERFAAQAIFRNPSSCPTGTPWSVSPLLLVEVQ